MIIRESTSTSSAAYSTEKVNLDVKPRSYLTSLLNYVFRMFLPRSAVSRSRPTSKVSLSSFQSVDEITKDEVSKPAMSNDEFRAKFFSKN